jgi:hypothetical protein
MPVPRLVLTLLLGVWLTLGASSCLSPAIPLPPPELNSVHEAGDGAWTISGTCSPGARVTVIDDRSGRGVVIEDRRMRGTFVVTLFARACDTATIIQELDDETSETGFVIQEHTFGSPTGGRCIPGE